MTNYTGTFSTTDTAFDINVISADSKEFLIKSIPASATKTTRYLIGAGDQAIVIERRKEKDQFILETITPGPKGWKVEEVRKAPLSQEIIIRNIPVMVDEIEAREK